MLKGNGRKMKHLKKVFIYCIVSIISLMLCLFLYFHVETRYVQTKAALVQAGYHRTEAQVDSIIARIDTYRKYLPEEKVKKIVHDTLGNVLVDGNQYVWINEVVNWDGGDNYAFRFVHPNFPETEGLSLSTSLSDSHGKFPYLTELQGIKENGEIHYQYYFKNYLNDEVELKYSYAKLYKDYHWIIACGIPESDLLAPSYDNYQKEKQSLYLFFMLVALIDVFICFIIYSQKKRQEIKEKNLISFSKAEAKNEFFSTLSHELRTPLNAIIGLNDLLRENCNDAKSVMNYSLKIDDASKILLSLINDVLDLSAIEKGKMKIEQKDFSVKRIIYSVSEIYANLAEKKGLTFNVILGDVPHEELIGDQYRIRQILLNLLSNALKFTETGSLSLSIHEESLEESKIHLIFAIRDTGCGMRQNFISHLFEEFEQADASVASVHGGSGLGLAIVKNLIALMQGTIEVSSHIQGGSQFTVNLPLLISPNEEKIVFSADSHTALIVDNDVHRIQSLTHLCDTMKIPSFSFTSCVKALAYIEDHPCKFSFCLLNDTLSHMTGVALAYRIREKSQNSPLIFVLSDNLNTIQMQEDSCISGFMQKPLFASELYHHLSQSNPLEEKKCVDENPKRYDGCKILSVEDNAINQLIITKILEKVGIEVFAAENGVEAVDFMQNNKERDAVDLILMDERMPRMDGLTATKKIRAFNTHIPIIALSANAFKEDVERSLQAGMNAHLSKPLDRKLLYKILDTYLT